MYIYIYIYIYICMYVYVYIHTYTYTHIYGSGQLIKRDHRAEVPKSRCSKLWMATNGAGKARIWMKICATCLMRHRDSDYEGPGADVGPGDPEYQF